MPRAPGATSHGGLDGPQCTTWVSASWLAPVLMLWSCRQGRRPGARHWPYCPAPSFRNSPCFKCCLSLFFLSPFFSPLPLFPLSSFARSSPFARLFSPFLLFPFVPRFFFSSSFLYSLANWPRLVNRRAVYSYHIQN